LECFDDSLSEGAMAKKRTRAKKAANEGEVLLKKILITQLAIAGVGQREIARIVGISLGAVNPIAHHVKLPKRPRD
jgi:DNA-directed RNA polymerase specialized sigma24 family protein